ncbi:hypothetical protein [Sphingomonas sp.]|uniref:hypothetical protein n=1 Tax=Sphingomonas sp. TaxID=28214 RepID=UPI003D6DA183
MSDQPVDPLPQAKSDPRKPWVSPTIITPNVELATCKVYYNREVSNSINIIGPS